MYWGSRFSAALCGSRLRGPKPRLRSSRPSLGRMFRVTWRSASRSHFPGFPCFLLWFERRQYFLSLEEVSGWEQGWRAVIPALADPGWESGLDAAAVGPARFDSIQRLRQPPEPQCAQFKHVQVFRMFRAVALPVGRRLHPCRLEGADSRLRRAGDLTKAGVPFQELPMTRSSAQCSSVNYTW